MPILFSRKELQRGTGGNGASRGGDGQIISFSMRTRDEWLLNAVTSRTTLASERLEGGEPDVAGRFLINGQPVSNARKIVMQPSDEVLLTTPGGGGYGRAAALPRAAE